LNIERLKLILSEILGEENVKENVDMAKHTSFKAGGKARLLVEPQNMEQLRYTLFLLGGKGSETEGHSACESCSNSAGCTGCTGCSGCNGCNDDSPEYMVLGNGSNVLVRDGGYDGVIIKMGAGFDYVHAEGDVLVAGSSTIMPVVARKALAEELTGFEFASGIPGSIGGAVFMNAGAYDGEIRNIIKYVKLISKDGTVERMVGADELDFSYRHSKIQSTEEIVTEVVLQLAKGNKDEINEKMKDLAKRRNEKQPVNLPSAGSFFKRPEGYFAGALIEGAGLKGLSVGGAQVSPLHAGFIVNNGNATATEIEQLMRLVQNTVFSQTGVQLHPEVRIIGKELVEENTYGC